MNALARRAALKLGFGAALATPTAAAQLQTHLKHGADLSGSSWLGSQPTLGHREIMDPIQRAAVRLFRQKDREHDQCMRYRVGAFDHDVAVCGSWSLAFKANVQRARDDEARSILNRFRIAAWGDDDG